MDEQKQNLKIASYVIIVLAIINLVCMVVDFTNGQLRGNVEKVAEETISQTESATEDLTQMKDTIVNVALGTAIGAVAVGILFDLYLGIAGLRQANGKSKGKVNIILATIVFVLALIGMGMQIGPLTKGQVAVSSFISNLAGLLIMFYYIRYAKKVVDAKE